MIVKYIAGASGRETILNQDYYITISECSPFYTVWNYESEPLQYGCKITGFGKDAISLPVGLRVKGSAKNIRENAEMLFRDMEKDIIEKKQGKLVIGDWYLRGFFIEHQTSPSREFYGRDIACNFLAPYSFWIQEYTQQFYPGYQEGNSNFLEFPYDFLYDFSAPNAGYYQWNVNHYASSKFKMIIYGPCANPRILINSHPYEVFDTLEKNEYIIVDSRDNTVRKYLSNGTVQNIYDLRGKTKSVFEKIPSGMININWNGAFGFDITLYLERSQPEWKSYLET